MLDPKFKHDSMTLSRAGIFGHWEDVSDKSTDGFNPLTGLYSIKTVNQFVVDGFTSSFSQVFFFAGIKNRTQDKVDEAKSAQSIPALLGCLGMTSERQINVPNGGRGPITTAMTGLSQFIRSGLGAPNALEVSRWKEILSSIQSPSETLLVCHSNGCPTLATAISNLREDKQYKNFSVGGIVAIAPNTNYLRHYESLSASSNSLTIIASPNDSGLNQSLFLGGMGRPSRNRIGNNIGTGKKLPNADLFVTSQSGHGIQYYVPDMRRLGYCTTPTQ